MTNFEIMSGSSHERAHENSVSIAPQDYAFPALNASDLRANQALQENILPELTIINSGDIQDLITSQKVPLTDREDPARDELNREDREFEPMEPSRFEQLPSRQWGLVRDC